MTDIIFKNLPWDIVAGLITLMALLALAPLAKKYKLLDLPGGRKQHHGEIPLIGGIGIYFAIAGIFLLAENIPLEIKWLLGSGGFLVIIGFLDDLLDIKPFFKLIGQIIAATIMCIGSDIYIRQIGILPNGDMVNIGMIGPFLTVFVVVGMTNAFNFIDGIDGLAGLMAMIAVTAVMLIITLTGGYVIHDESLGIFRGAIGGYLLVNMAIVTPRKAFLGDAGSMLIGFVIAWILVYYSQLPPDRALPASMTLWVVALPVIDTIIIMWRRMGKGKSPFKPDRRHLHHIFQRFGFTALQTLAVICLLSIGLTTVGLIAYMLGGDAGASLLFVGLIIAYHYIIKHSWRISSLIRKFF